MAGLKEWVRELTMLVILGTCLELLIPANGMKKYIRMTMGLVVVLAVVSPIAAFLGRPVVVETISFGPPEDGRLPTIGEIMNQAKEFRERNQTLALTEVKVRLSEEARAAALSVRGVAAARAEIGVQVEKGENRITAVTVIITPGTGPSKIRRVEPVRPGGATATAPSPPAEPTPADSPLADAVRREVAARLGIGEDPKVVRVLVER